MSYVSRDDQTASISLQGMLSQLGLNLALGAGTLIIFSFLRPRNKIVYAPKSQHVSEKKQLPQLEKGLWSWVKPVLTADEKLLLEKIGLDALMFIRFLKLCQKIFVYLTLVGLLLIAVNAYGSVKDSGGVPVGDNPLQILSISYLVKDSWFWVHAIVTWIFSVLVYYLLYSEYDGYLRLRLKYFRSDEYVQSLHSRTLLVTNLRSSQQSDQGLRDFYTLLKFKYPISQAAIGKKVENLPDLLEKHDKNVRKLENILNKYLKDPNNIPIERPKHRINGFFGDKVDSIDYYTQKICAIEEQINQVRSQLSEEKATSYGFISFANIPYAHAVAKRLERGIKVDNTPEVVLASQPKDIIWSNISLPKNVRGTKKLVGSCLFAAFCFFWFIPLGFLSAAAQIDNIVKIAPWTAHVLYYNDFLTGLFEAWMTPLIMALFFILLPYLLRYLSKHQGKLTHSSLDRAVLGKLYLFFFINNLIFYTLSSTVIQVWARVKRQINEGDRNLNDFYQVAKETDFLNHIARSLIEISSFWINYLSLRGVGSLLDLAQAFPLVVISIKKLFLYPSPRNLKEFARPPDFDYANFYNLHLFLFTVGILYSVIAPLILVFCCFYFTLSNLVYRYQLMYVFTTKIETGGTFWRVVFNRFIVAILFWQLVMIGVMNLKGAHFQSLSVIPLPFLTILLKVICARRFDHRVRYYLGDNSDPERGDNKSDTIAKRFEHPALTAELTTPMVFSNVAHLLPQVYNGRIEETTVVRRGTVRAVSMVRDKNHEIQIQSVEEGDLYDEQTFYEEQNPGYYHHYSDDDYYASPRN